MGGFLLALDAAMQVTHHRGPSDSKSKCSGGTPTVLAPYSRKKWPSTQTRWMQGTHHKLSVQFTNPSGACTIWELMCELADAKKNCQDSEEGEKRVREERGRRVLRKSLGTKFPRDSDDA